MEFKFVSKKKEEVELEFDEKEVSSCLVSQLVRNGVDAYWYVPHPLMGGVRVHIDSSDPHGDLKKAVDDLGKEWTEFRKALSAKLK